MLESVLHRTLLRKICQCNEYKRYQRTSIDNIHKVVTRFSTRVRIGTVLPQTNVFVPLINGTRCPPRCADSNQMKNKRDAEKNDSHLGQD